MQHHQNFQLRILFFFFFSEFQILEVSQLASVVIEEISFVHIAWTHCHWMFLKRACVIFYILLSNLGKTYLKQKRGQPRKYRARVNTCHIIPFPSHSFPQPKLMFLGRACLIFYILLSNLGKTYLKQKREQPRKYGARVNFAYFSCLPPVT